MEPELAFFIFFAVMIMIMALNVAILKTPLVGAIVMFTALAVIAIMTYAVWSWLSDG